MKAFLPLVFVALHLLSFAGDKPRIGFLPGVLDPFYQAMGRGARQAAADAGLDIVVQMPAGWGPTVQAPMLDAMVARADLDYLIVAPTDREQMIAPLQSANEAGLRVITVDTFIGNGDYESGPVTFPLSHIGSDNHEGGRIAGEALAAAIGGAGKVYIQNTNVGVSTTEQRSAGFRAALREYPRISIIGEDYNLDDANTSVEQTGAVLLRERELAGIFGVNVFSAQGAGTAVQNAGLGGVVHVVAFDATEFAIERLRDGVISLVIAQKPFDMGYLAVVFALAHHRGVTSLPKRVPAGYAVITAKNLDDPGVARFIYRSR